MKESPVKTILFQGDSITDVKRLRDDPSSLGQGYPNMVSGHLGLQHPGKYNFINRGIGGNRIVDLYARMKCDIVNLKPDYLSILIGVNDVWHEKSKGNGVSAPKFKKVYGMMLEELKEEFPEIKIILLEPFVLPGTATEDAFEWFKSEVDLRAKAVKELAEEFNLPFIPLQEDLDKLTEVAPAEYWLKDGVHPTVFFHQHIAKKWIDTFLAIE